MEPVQKRIRQPQILVEGRTRPQGELTNCLCHPITLVWLCHPIALVCHPITLVCLRSLALVWLCLVLWCGSTVVFASD